VLSFWGNSRTVFADPDDGDDTDTTELERQREENESRLDEINATIEELAAEQEGIEEEIEEIRDAIDGKTLKVIIEEEPGANTTSSEFSNSTIHN